MMKRLKDGYTKDTPDLVFFMVVRSVLLILVLLLLRKYTKVSVVGTVSVFNLEVDVSTVGQYTILSDTEIVCDTNTVYYIIKQMEEDGYKLTVVNSTEKKLDFILERSDYVHHLLYVTSGKLTCISSPYEKSYLPFTYIYEKSIN